MELMDKDFIFIRRHNMKVDTIIKAKQYCIQNPISYCLDYLIKEKNFGQRSEELSKDKASGNKKVLA